MVIQISKEELGVILKSVIDDSIVYDGGDSFYCTQCAEQGNVDIDNIRHPASCIYKKAYKMLKELSLDAEIEIV